MFKSSRTQKVERKFAKRNVTKLVVDAGQQTDRGRETRSNDVDEPVRSVEPAGRIERLLSNKRGLSASQTRQMARGEIEVEEEKRARMKRLPVLPTDRVKHENNCVPVANRNQCKTEDSRKPPENESSVPRVAMDRGFLAHGTDVTNIVLIQKVHCAVEARQVSHEVPEPRAVNCVLENLETSELGKVLLKGDAG